MKVCLHSPTMPVTLNAGFKMPSWFDLRTLDATGPEDEEGIRKASEMVHGMIAEEVAAGIPSKRINAVGNKNIPVLQCHGDCDPIVPYKWGQMTASLLKQFMSQVKFKTYSGMMHSSCDQEMQDMKSFIEKLVKP
ncbi:hypothetical protein G9C98_004235 [Cotesia typhae]|uniref:Phospholipase/carboxylesterase/thioesterase domain-containing protein n=1 Tax=Cotesia typhae TaxID=2053667 RepID=A0A8J5QMK8_9HYME|nr:hypothetical protein G9C98_004235 [Cotesia typhae]